MTSSTALPAPSRATAARRRAQRVGALVLLALSGACVGGITAPDVEVPRDRSELREPSGGGGGRTPLDWVRDKHEHSR